MRVWMLLVLLAGCSASIPEQGPVSPLHSGAGYDEGIVAENVSMDPVSGVTSADGTIVYGCAFGFSAMSAAKSAWTFKVGTNATSMRITADWAPTNPTTETLTVELAQGGGPFAAISGEPGKQHTVDVTTIPADDRSVQARLADPSCRSDPAAIHHYDGVSGRLHVEFEA